MTTTVQPCSWAVLNKSGGKLYDRSLYEFKGEAEGNEELILSIFDSLNTLNESLNRLDYLIRRKEIERILYPKGKGERNED
jgi:hypothetical protein